MLQMIAVLTTIAVPTTTVTVPLLFPPMHKPFNSHPPSNCATTIPGLPCSPKTATAKGGRSATEKTEKLPREKVGGATENAIIGARLRAQVEEETVVVVVVVVEVASHQTNNTIDNKEGGETLENMTNTACEKA